MSDVEGPPGQPDSVPLPRLLDRQGWSTLVAGSLLLLISFTTNYGDDNPSRSRRPPAAVALGVGLHVAALAALASDAQLASRLRHRAANETAADRSARKREAHEAARERVRAERARTGQALEAARDREQAARRARIQNGCLTAQCRF